MSFDYLPGAGWRVKHLSRRELKKIRDNMKKVPKIKQKADFYHKQEEQQAEREFLAQIDQISQPVDTNLQSVSKYVW